jgi:hypothetical protein
MKSIIQKYSYNNFQFLKLEKEKVTFEFKIIGIFQIKNYSKKKNKNINYYINYYIIIFQNGKIKYI